MVNKRIAVMLVKAIDDVISITFPVANRINPIPVKKSV
jgi:hypothetical protein